MKRSIRNEANGGGRGRKRQHKGNREKTGIERERFVIDQIREKKKER